jgi:hypothetical protein
MDFAPVRFSVVIPCYDQGSFLHEALASVRAQTLPAHEVIVVDDGSTDPFTVARIDELCQGGVILVRQTNRGLPGARNAGVRRATGEFIVPLDADDQLTPDALTSYARRIRAQPEVDIWYPDIQHFGLTNDVWIAPELNRWHLLQANQLSCASAIHRRVFDAGVFYNEAMRGGYEDWEFCVHACCERGFTARPLEKAVFRYRRWGFSMLSASDLRADELRAQIRRERPVYRDEARLTALKRASSPFFSVALRAPAGAAASPVRVALARQAFQDFCVVDGASPIDSGDLALFQAQPGRALVIAIDDAALARSLGADPYLLEKLARATAAQAPPFTWLTTTGVEHALPGVFADRGAPTARWGWWCRSHRSSTAPTSAGPTPG